MQINLVHQKCRVLYTNIKRQRPQCSILPFQCLGQEWKERKNGFKPGLSSRYYGAFRSLPSPQCKLELFWFALTDTLLPRVIYGYQEAENSHSTVYSSHAFTSHPTLSFLPLPHMLGARSKAGIELLCQLYTSQRGFLYREYFLGAVSTSFMAPNSYDQTLSSRSLGCPRRHPF